MDDVVLARALHVLGVIHWIGGLSFVTLIILPLSRSRGTPGEMLALFDSVERRFSAQVRVTVPLVGATGLWMTNRLDLWYRFVDPQFWWMSAMLGLWAVFMVMPFERQAQQEPITMFRLTSRLHIFLLTVAAIIALGAVAGANGFVFF